MIQQPHCRAKQLGLLVELHDRWPSNRHMDLTGTARAAGEARGKLTPAEPAAIFSRMDAGTATRADWTAWERDLETRLTYSSAKTAAADSAISVNKTKAPIPGSG